MNTHTVTTWLAAHASGAYALGVGVVAFLLLYTLTRRIVAPAWRKRHRANAAMAPASGTDTGIVNKKLSPRTATVAVMVTALSLDGMYRVFTYTLHWPWILTGAVAGTIDFSAFEFGKQAREERLSNRTGGWQIGATWVLALLSGALSAAAALLTPHPSTAAPGQPAPLAYHPGMEAAVRFVLPSVAMLLLHSWMVPKLQTVTLSERQEARGAWRFLRTKLFADRASWFATQWIGSVAHRWASDQLAKNAIQTAGGVTDVYRTAREIAVTTMLAALPDAGRPVLDRSAPDDDPPPHAQPETGPGTGPDQTDNQTGPDGETGPDRTGKADRGPDRIRPDRTEKQTVNQTSKRTGPDRTGRTQRTGIDNLEKVCRAWADAHSADPDQMTRQNVLDACREAGFSCSNERAGQLIGLLDPKGATEEMERGLAQTGPSSPE